MQTHTHAQGTRKNYVEKYISICAVPNFPSFDIHRARIFHAKFGFACRQQLTPQQLNSGTNPTGLATTLMLCV